MIQVKYCDFKGGKNAAVIPRHFLKKRHVSSLLRDETRLLLYCSYVLQNRALIPEISE